MRPISTIAPGVLLSMATRYPWMRHVFADGGYAGDKLVHALAGKARWTIRIIKRPKDAKGFVLLPGAGPSNGLSRA